MEESGGRMPPPGPPPEPPHVEAILRVIGGMQMLQEELLRITEERKKKLFEEEAASLTKIVISDIDEALEILKPSPDHAQAIGVLKKIRNSLPRRMKQFVRLAKAGKWRSLRGELEKRLQEAIRTIETKALEPIERDH
jgi:hypothetical protein